MFGRKNLDNDMNTIKDNKKYLNMSDAFSVTSTLFVIFLAIAILAFP